MKRLTIGTKENPVRMSATPMWVKCPWFAIFRAELPDDVGLAAHIGTAADRAIKLIHDGVDVEEAIKIALGESPTVDDEMIRPMVEGYADDMPLFDRGYGEYKSKYADAELHLEYEGVHFVGHPDQVREKDGVLYLWDMKASRFGGNQLTFDYVVQLAVYTEAIRQQFGVNCQVGGIIRLSDYKSRQPGPVFYQLELNDSMRHRLLHVVCKNIRRVQRGILPDPVPGPQCGYCVGEGPHKCEELMLDLVSRKCEICGKVNCRKKHKKTSFKKVKGLEL